MYTLRDYQREASDRAVRFFSDTRSNRNGLLILPTGAGKSLICADIARQLRGDLLILQPSKEILEQNYSKYRSFGLSDGAVYSASMSRKEIGKVTFATIKSIMSHVDDFSHFEAVIVDEAHCVNALGGQYEEFLTRVRRKVLGMTATPYRLYSQQGVRLDDGTFLPNGGYKEEDYFVDPYTPMPGVELGNACILKFITRTRPRIFHDVIYSVSVRSLLDKGFLSPLRYFDLTQIDTRRVRRNSTGRDYDEGALSDEFARVGLVDQLSDIVQRLLRPKSGVPRKGILVFTRFIDEARSLAQRVLCVAIVTGETPKREREKIIEDFKAGRIKVVANVGVLTTGFDYPELDTIVMARPTMSLALWYQIVGRALRPCEGKDAWVVDIGGNLRRFGKVEDLDMEGTSGKYFFSGVVGGERKQLTNIYF